MPEPTNLLNHVDHFQRRVVQDALADGERGYWLRRSRVFEWARPKRDDYHGRATREDLTRRDAALAEAAENCRRRAGLSLWEVA